MFFFIFNEKWGEKEKKKIQGICTDGKKCGIKIGQSDLYDPVEEKKKKSLYLYWLCFRVWFMRENSKLIDLLISVLCADIDCLCVSLYVSVCGCVCVYIPVKWWESNM